MTSKQSSGAAPRKGGRTERPSLEEHEEHEEQTKVAQITGSTTGNDIVLQADRPVVRNGRSQSITIPNHIAEAISMQVGDTVRISVTGDGKLVIEPMEWKHQNGSSTLKPRKNRLVQPKVIPVIPEGRTIRKAGRMLRSSELPKVNNG